MLRLALAALAMGMLAQPALAADGATVFNQRCKACHQATSSTMGPALKGVSGAKIATRPGYKYSPALKKKAGVWTDAQLNTWLAGPAKFAPGTKMLVSITNPEDRTALVAYLKTLK